MSEQRLSIEALRARGEHIAIDGLASPLRYRQLAARALGVADALDAAGVAPGQRIGLLAGRRGANEAVSLCGVLAAGCVAVPLDHGSPALRIGGILQSSGCSALIYDEHASKLAGSVELPLARIELDEEGLVMASLGQARGAEPEPDLACVLHTSGSTGQPKAVPISWEGLNAFVDWMRGELSLSADDRVLRVAELVFDLAWFDHIATFRTGATLCVLSRRQLTAGRSLAAACQALKPSVIYGVPSLFMKLSDATEGPLTPAPRVVCFAGEVFPPRQLAAFARKVPGATLYNLYGPTETNVCTYHRLRDEDLRGEQEIPIGRPCPYADCELHDDVGALVAGAGSGELVVRGPTALNGEVRTRDRIERKADGLLYFRGRLDRMVKLRGYRVDPSEIEAALALHPEVVAAAVTVSHHPRLGLRLTGWVTLRDAARRDAGRRDAGRRDAEQQNAQRMLRRHLAARLASYMVPDRVRVLQELPRTVTGKLDYGALEARSD